MHIYAYMHTYMYMLKRYCEAILPEFGSRQWASTEDMKLDTKLWDGYFLKLTKESMNKRTIKKTEVEKLETVTAKRVGRIGDLLTTWKGFEQAVEYSSMHPKRLQRHR